jgi:hypothetical protein
MHLSGHVFIWPCLYLAMSLSRDAWTNAASGRQSSFALPFAIQPVYPVYDGSSKPRLDDNEIGDSSAASRPVAGFVATVQPQRLRLP